MLRTYRVRVRPNVLIDTAVTLHDRLGYAELDTCASLVLLDTAVLHSRLHGRDESVDWITRYLRDLQEPPPCPNPWAPWPTTCRRRAVRSAANCSAGTSDSGPATSCRNSSLRPGRRTAATAEPARSDALRPVVVGRGRHRARERAATAHRHPPRARPRIHGEHHRELPVPFLSAAELSARTNRTPAALAQTVRRFRAACQERFSEVTGYSLVQDAVIQGRPGYRLNPQSIYRFTEYSTESI